jgi:16S rRNA (guanine527-N7)-methyltransferase
VSGEKSNSDDISALDRLLDVSRETGERLERFVGLLRKWQAADNLIARGTLSSIWQRHIADSAQLATLFPKERRWLDLGSGAGFPGLVVAILLGGAAGTSVDLVESNQRKCAFLREAIRTTGAQAAVHCGRIESVVSAWDRPVGIVTARALAPLDRLFSLAEPVLVRGGRGAFHKGQDFESEIEFASKSWEYDLVIHRSRIEPRGVILEVRSLARKARTHSA